MPTGDSIEHTRNEREFTTEYQQIPWAGMRASREAHSDSYDALLLQLQELELQRRRLENPQPIIVSTQIADRTLNRNGVIYEINDGLQFFELSFISDPIRPGHYMAVKREYPDGQNYPEMRILKK